MSRTRSLLTLTLVLAASCGGGGSSGPDALPQTVCTDGLDNDGDGSTDFPADPGCDDASDTDESNPPMAMCSDGRDNDADGFIDYPNDPGCFNMLQNSEADDCPSGPTCPACANGADDDGDGATDFGQDSGCTAASDDLEWETNPNACGPGLVVSPLMGHDVTAILPGSPSNLTSASCGGAGGEIAYEIIIEDPSVLVASTDSAGTLANTVLYLRTSCLVPASEMTCNDDVNTDTDASKITASLTPGVYYLIIDSLNPTTAGQFQLHVDLFAGEGVACTTQAECGPGLQCRIPLGGTEMVCADPVCSDAVDDDGDTLDDYPDDPGCDSPGDFDEADTCPGAGCPACADGADNDVDGQTDYPADTDCSSASQPVEGCGVEQDPIFTLTTGSATGNLVGLHDDFDFTCDGTGGLDQVYFVVVPHMQQLVVDTEGSTTDTAVALYPSSCTGTALACDDDSGTSPGASRMVRNNLPAGAYALVVGNYSTSYPPGPYNLNLGGTIAAGGACDGPLAMSGAIACGPAFACVGGVCTGNLACNNGMDDDGDGDIDFPDDAGCTAGNDTDETDDCPSGPNCPACSNGMDDDGDGQTDYPMDTDCTSAGGDAEVCGVEQDPIVNMTTATITGATTGASMDFTLSCGFSGGAPDRVALITVPGLTSLHADMLGSNFDAVIALKTPTCGPADLVCNDAFSIGQDKFDYVPAGGIPAGTYAIVIDGYNTNAGNYTVNLSGKIKNNASCEGELALAGALTCGDGFVCKGPAGSRTCKRSQCNDTLDNDGDGKINFPNDPGCTDLADDSETDTCPGGGTCPVCGNGSDDDGDSLIDYPQDFGCSAASGTTEVACPVETDTMALVTQPVINSTTTGKANNFTPPTACVASSTAPDVTYILQLPVPVATLQIDTITSPFNTVLIFDEPTCATPPIACDNDGGGMQTSRIIRTDVSAGAYAITVDGGNAAAGNFALHVDGRVAPGSACTGPLFTSGVLACSVGESCVAGTCQ